eukprot:12927938-Prorocentrum_lima.AAC.1
MFVRGACAMAPRIKQSGSASSVRPLRSPEDASAFALAFSAPGRAVLCAFLPGARFQSRQRS